MYSITHALYKGVRPSCQRWMWTRERWAATRLFWPQPDTTTRSVFGRPTAASAPGQSSTRIRYPYSKLQTIIHYKNWEDDVNFVVGECYEYCKILDSGFWLLYGGAVYITDVQYNVLHIFYQYEISYSVGWLLLHNKGNYNLNDVLS